LPDSERACDALQSGAEAEKFNAMRTGSNRRIRYKKAKGQEPLVVVLLVALGMVVFICAGLLAAPLWRAAVEVWQFRSSGQECRTLKDAAARQACYEELNARAARHAIKGQN
jgi:hypothetical protein